MLKGNRLDTIDDKKKFIKSIAGHFKRELSGLVCEVETARKSM